MKLPWRHEAANTMKSFVIACRYGDGIHGYELSARDTGNSVE